jgi:hypothetical protein
MRKQSILFVIGCTLASVGFLSMPTIILAEDSSEKPARVNAMSLHLGGRGALAWTVSRDSWIIDTGGSGGNASLGGAAHFFPMRALSIDSGFRYRVVGVGMRGDVTFREFQIPATLSLHVPTGSDGASFIFAGGISFLKPLGGYINRTVASQASFGIPAADLKSGVSYTLMIGLHSRIFEDRMYYRLEFGFEYAERSLDIITRDLFIGLELGAILF